MKADTVVIPPPPRFLSLEAKSWWRFYAQAMHARGGVNAADLGGLAELSEVAAELTRLRKVIAERGGQTAYEATSVSGEKLWRAYPEVSQVADASRRLAALLNAYGLTPASRGRVARGDRL